jgi:O-antigen/teichoic acid export membrane protein
LQAFIHGAGRSENLKSAAAWNAVGTLIYSGCQWGVLVVAVRCLPVSDVGLLSLGFAICAPIFLFFQLRLRSASAADVNTCFKTSDYIGLRIICILLAILVVFAVCAISQLSREKTSVIAAVALAKALESGSDLFYGLSQRANNMRKISISMIARGCLSLTAFTVLLSTTRSLLFGLLGICLAWGTILVTVDIPIPLRSLWKRMSPLFHSWRTVPVMWSLVLATLPLGVSTMLTSLSVNLPRYFIERIAGSGQLGIFAATAYLATAASIIVTALAEAGVSAIARLITSGRFGDAQNLMNKILGTTVVLSALGIAVAALFGRGILQLIYGRTYTSGADLLFWMMVAAGISNIASVYGFTLVAGREHKGYLVCLATSSILICAGCFLLIPAYGLYGAVSACIGGYMIQALLSYRKTKALLNVQRSTILRSVTLDKVAL